LNTGFVIGESKPTFVTAITSRPLSVGEYIKIDSDEGEILGLVVKHSEVMNSHSKCIHALENFVRWFLTCKEGLSLVEANKILNGDK